MKVEKRNNKYYVNELPLEEVMCNRKYIVNYIDRRIDELKSMKHNRKLYNFNAFNKGELTTLLDIREKLELRRK